MLLSAKDLSRRIYLIRGHRVMLDADLARLYEVEVKVLNQAVRRNQERFPADFMFQLSEIENEHLRSQFVTLEKGRGKYSKFMPLAFTEQGVAMLSGVLRSSRAVQVNIEIMRAFVKLREMTENHKELASKLNQLESKYDRQFKVVFDAIRQLMTPSKPLAQKRIKGLSQS